MNSDRSDSSEGTLVRVGGQQRDGVNAARVPPSEDSDGKVEPVSRADGDQSVSLAQRTTLSYEAFQGEFRAERIQLYLPASGRESLDQTLSDDASTSDDVSTILEDNLIKLEQDDMPLQFKSRYEDRRPTEEQPVGTSKRKTWERPQSAGEANPLLSDLQAFSSGIQNQKSSKNSDLKAKAGLRRYNSAGDISKLGQTLPFGKKRQLPDLSTCKRLAASDIEDADFSDDSDTVEVTPPPGDRKTLEAQFKLLYRENLKLDKAYGELQEKVRSQSPQILSSRFQSPRETEWQLERRKYKREIERLTSKISEMEAHNAMESETEISPNSKKTEEYFQEKLNNLQKVKDEEIARLNEQVSYWLRQAYMQQSNQALSSDPRAKKSSDELQERIADLEQSEAFLQCQIVNLEDKLINANKELATTKKQNNDLGEHCNKLENCLAVFDAEKALLDDLKNQNSELRSKLAANEQNEQILVQKLAQLVEEKAEIESRVSSPRSTKHDDSDLKEELRKATEGNHELKETNRALNDRCSGLEELKECLIQQMASIEEDCNNKMSKLTDQTKKLNENIKSVKEERDSLLETNERHELNQELNLNMNEKLNKRIADLQGHIETLKSQLENEKAKIQSFDDIHEQLNKVSFEKSTLEALCTQYRADMEGLQNRLSNNQERLSDSFEKVNQQLIEETDEMANRQRNLVVENQTLRMRSCSRGFEAVIGNKLRESTTPLIDSCISALYEAHSAIGSLVEPDYDSWTGEEVDLNALSDEEAIRILNEYGDELIGTTVTELQHLQEQSPRLGDVASLSQLIDSVKTSHNIICNLHRLKEKTLVFRDSVEEREAERAEAELASNRPPSRELASPSLEISSSRIAERTSLQEKIDSLQEELKTTKRVLQFLKEENEHLTSENTKDEEVSSLKREVEIFRKNEQVLLDKLNKSQESCDSLMSRTRALQEEKYELIQRCAEVGNVSELKAKVESTQRKLSEVEKENLYFAEEKERILQERFSIEKLLKEQIDTLSRDLSAAGSRAQEMLNGSKRQEEESLKKFHSLIEENSRTIGNLKEKIERLEKKLDEKENKLEQLEEEFRDVKEQLESAEEAKSSIKQQLQERTSDMENLQTLLHEKATLASNLEEERKELKFENSEMKIKLDLLESEKEKVKEDRSDQVGELEVRLLQSQQHSEQLNEIIEERNRALAGLKLQLKDTQRDSGQEEELEENPFKLINELESLQKTNKRLECQVQDAQVDVNRVNKEKEDLKSEISLLQISLDKAKEDGKLIVKNLEDELAEQVTRSEQARKLFETTKDELDSLSLNMKELLEKNLQLTTELSDKNETIIELRHRARRLDESDSLEERGKAADRNSLDLCADSTSNESHMTAEAKYNNAGREETSGSEQVAMSSELEYFKQKCSTLERELNDLKNEGQLINSSVEQGQNKRSSKRVSSADGKATHKRLRRSLSAMKTASSSSCEGRSSSSASTGGCSSDSDDASARSVELVTLSTDDVQQVEASEKAENLNDLMKENLKLKEKIVELEGDLEVLNRREDSTERVSWLQVENKRLLDVLKHAEKEVEDGQAERRRLEEIVENLRKRVYESEGWNQQSGTESEPEAVRQERRRRNDNETTKEIENLKMHLEETECHVVAQKNKLNYLEEVNEDLRLVNGKLKRENEELERQLQLPAHPVVEKVKAEMQEKGFSKAQLGDDVTLGDSWTECETIPLDRVMHGLCEKVLVSEDIAKKKEDENEKLSASLREAVEKMQTAEERNVELEQQSLNFTQRNEEAEQEVNRNKNELLELEEILTRNQVTAKEALQSKEEEIDTLQDQVMALSSELEQTSSMMAGIKQSRDCESEEYQRELGSLRSEIITITEELQEKTNESVNLLNETQILTSQTEDIKKEVIRRENEIKGLKNELERLQKDNEQYANLAEESSLANQRLASTIKDHDVTIEHLQSEISALELSRDKLKEAVVSKDENLTNLNSTLNEKEEQISTLSSRMEEMMETEEALKKTIDSADDMIAEREQEHHDEVMQLKSGLDRTLSEAQRAEMTSDELLKEISRLEERNGQLHDEIESLQKKESDVDYQIETIEIEKALLNTTLESEREERDEAVERSKFLAKENEELNEMNKSLQDTIERLQEQIADMYNQCEESAHDVQTKDREVVELSEELSRLRRQIDDTWSAEELVSTTRSAVDNRETERIKDELEATREELANINNTVAHLRREKAQLEVEIQNFHLEFPPSMMLSSPLPSERRDVSEQTEPSEFVSELSLRSLQDESYSEMVIENAIKSRLQEESTSLRSENEALRSKIASLENNLTVMTERLVPRLELGSIADESEVKGGGEGKPRDDDTGRFVDDIDTAREAGAVNLEVLEEKLRMSEDAGAKLLLQVQELEEETEMLRSNAQVLADKNDAMQKEFFGSLSEDYQAQVDELFNTNYKLKLSVNAKESEINSLQEQLKKATSTESHWRNRCKEEQNNAEELRQRLEDGQRDNRELQLRLVDLDRECQSLLDRNQSSQIVAMKQTTSEASAQTLSIAELVDEIKRDQKGKRKTKPIAKEKEDTDDDVSDLTSTSHSSLTSSSAVHLNPVGSGTQITNLADDQLLQASILKGRKEPSEESFNIEEVPEPITDSLTLESSQVAVEPSSHNTVKSLQNEVIGCQLIIEKLKRRNQELLEGSGAIMTQDEKEALEREISALRGQLALLERNNRIFSDRERNDLKQDLEFAKKRSGHIQSELQSIKASLEYEEMEKLKKQLVNTTKEADELRKQLQSARTDVTSESGSDWSDPESTARHNKYARLLELEEEAAEVKKQLEERDEDLKDRDVMIEELQHRLSSLKEDYEKEIEEMEKNNKKRENELREEVRELERDVAEKKEVIEMKQKNLRNKTEKLDSCELEIENLEREIQRKKKEMEQLKWEIEALQRENFSLRERIDRLKHSLSAASDSVLIDAGISPVGTYYSPVIGSPPSRVRSRTSTPRSSFVEQDDRGKLSMRSSDAVEHPIVDAELTHRSTPRPRRTYSFGDDEEDSPTTALREAIYEAKETVHQMGDVLDTPRMTPRRLSPFPKSDRSHNASPSPNPSQKPPSENDKTSGLMARPERARRDRKNQEDRVFDDQDEDSSSHSSTSTSASSSSSIVLKPSSVPQDSEKATLKQSDDIPLQLSLLSLPSQNSTKTLEDTRKSEGGKRNDAAGGESNNKAPEREGRSEYLDERPFSSDANAKRNFEDLPTLGGSKSVSSSSSLSQSSTEGSHAPSDGELNEPSLSVTRSHEQFSPKKSFDKSDTKHDSAVEDEEHDSANKKHGETAEEHLTSPLQTKLPNTPKAQATDLSANTEADGVLGPDISTDSAPLSAPAGPQVSVSLLPDDRPTLIQEVAKAREEARKWFAEVTESDREKRLLSRRLEALENELVRLKGVEDNYELIKKQHEEMKRVSDELEQARAQVESANRKAEEAKERNALLRAHLLDKEEIENENSILKKHAENHQQRHRQKSPSSPLPLSELQEQVETTKPLRAMSLKPAESKQPPTDKQLRQIKDSFEYIATNFADVVLESHEKATQLVPFQDKVSKLKKKCMDRDQLLAKLVLKLRKKKEEDGVDSHDDSLASSTGLESILSQADKVIRHDAVESDSSAIDDDRGAKKKRSKVAGKSPEKKESRHSSRSSSITSLMRSLGSKSPGADHSLPTHRIYIARHDYSPSKSTPPPADNRIPITHSLLPDLHLLSGDTVVAIGNPDERADGKLYQMAEVHGKIGFVPLAHLVPAEQVEGMQTFLQERGKVERKKSPSSSPDKIVDLYKKLEQAQMLVNDKMNRNVHVKPKTKRNQATPDAKQSAVLSPLKPNEPLHEDSSENFKKPPHSNRPKITDCSKDFDDVYTDVSTITSSNVSAQPRFDARRSKASRRSPLPARDVTDNRFAHDQTHTTSFDANDVLSDVIRTSTPVDDRFQTSRHPRSSSLPPRRESSGRSSKPDRSSSGRFASPHRDDKAEVQKRGRSHSTSRSRSKHHSDESFRSLSSSQPLQLPSVPDPPTFLVVEKTMGQKSMIICWTPPLLDMISRSNNIPVIGYEISVDKKRKVQISGAYTNKAILGDLDLKRRLLIEIRTVSSVGTLSNPCEVIFTPNLRDVSLPASSRQSIAPNRNNSTLSASSKPTADSKRTNKKTKDNSTQSPKTHRATALYDYDPAVDSPYKTHDHEVALRQGDDVVVLGSPRADGFCDVKVDTRRGYAPIAFLLSSFEESFDSASDVSMTRMSKRSKY